MNSFGINLNRHYCPSVKIFGNNKIGYNANFKFCSSSGIALNEREHSL